MTEVDDRLFNRFVWTPADIRLVKRAKPNVKKEAQTEGGKSDMPLLHKRQLEVEAKSLEHGQARWEVNHG